MRITPLLTGAVVLLAAVVITVDHSQLGLDRFMPKPAAPAAPPAAFVMPVPVVSVVKATIPINLSYAARTESPRAVALQSKVAAFLMEQRAPDGSDVQAGQLLYQLDPRDYQVALDTANAQIQRDSAGLTYQTSSFQRGTELSKTGYLAKDTFDQRSSTMQQAQASLQADRAAARGAQLNLDYTQIKAPFAGRLGRNQAPTGTLVSPMATVLNTLVQLDPIYVTFGPSETDLAAMNKARAMGTVPVDVVVPGSDTAVHKGEVTFVDNVVDSRTGTVVARATIANADQALLPGQYVRIDVHVRDQPDALMVPQAAVGSSQLGKYVFVVGADSKIEQRIVTLGPTQGPLVSLLTGVKEGDQVVTGNLQKIGPGMPVKALPQAGTKT